MRIAIYSHSLPPSIDGVCRRMSSLIYELLLAHHEVLVFTLEEDIGGLDLQGLPRPPFVTLESSFPAAYPAKRVASPTLTNVARIAAAFQAFRPDVAHVTVDALTLLFGAVGIVLGVPVAGSIHTDVDKILRSLNAAEWVVRTGWMLESADSLFLDACATTSPSYREELSQRGCWIDHVVLTSVNTSVFHPTCVDATERRTIRAHLTFGHPEAFLMVYVGRLSKEKSIDVLIDALRRRPGMEGVYLALFGDGPIAEDLARLHGDARRVYCVPGFLGHRELAQVYAAADAHVSASAFETLGNTVLESFATGTPVIVPRAQGFRDTVSSEVDGLFFDHPSPEGLADCVLRLRGDPALRQTMGQAGRTKVGGLSAAAVALDYVAWYQRTVARREARAENPLKVAALVAAVWPLAIAFMIVLRAYDAAVAWYMQAASLPGLLAAPVPEALPLAPKLPSHPRGPTAEPAPSSAPAGPAALPRAVTGPAAPPGPPVRPKVPRMPPIPAGVLRTL